MANPRMNAQRALDAGSRGRRRRRRVGFLGGVAGLAGIAAVASWWALEAIEERRAAAAARELQIVSMEVVTADIVSSMGESVAMPDLASSIDGLRGDHDLALHALSPGDAERTRELLTEIVETGSLHFHPNDPDRYAEHHDELHDLLGAAADNAEADAGEAERTAGIAIVGALVALSIGAWVLVRSRHRSDRERSRAEARALVGKRLESLINDSPEIFLVIEPSGRIVFQSASAGLLLPADSRHAEDLVGLTAPSLQPELREHLRRSDEGSVSEVFALTDVHGQAGSYEVRVSDLTDDRVVSGHVVTVRDITNEVRLRDELHRLANTDVLTGLPNRRVVPETIDAAKHVVRTEGTTMALLTLDIDGFKVINDTLGHPAGDELLRSVARRLTRALESDEELIRLGGDEFAVVVPRIASAADARACAHRLLGVLQEPFQLGDRYERVCTSIGVATTSDPDHVDALLTEADIAMYEAKRQGGDAAVAYDPALVSESNRTTQITRALRVADHDAEFRVVYQPIVTADDRRVVGLEALLRWKSPELGQVPPDEFISVAEVSGEIGRIGKWVIDSVCRQLAMWTDSGIDPDIAVSFNVSPLQLAEDDFVPSVLATANAWSISPRRLVVEVTESTALEPTGVARARLDQLRQAGLRVSIDDFGSGYSNLGQLLRVPFDTIKIDRSLLLTLSAMREESGADASGPCTMMEAIVSIAGILGAPVVCEGVETEQQRASLRASGISYIQGYLTGPPLPATTITAQLCGPARRRALAEPPVLAKT